MLILCIIFLCFTREISQCCLFETDNNLRRFSDPVFKRNNQVFNQNINASRKPFSFRHLATTSNLISNFITLNHPKQNKTNCLKGNVLKGNILSHKIKPLQLFRIFYIMHIVHIIGLYVYLEDFSLEQ